ncbi:DUF192 domain-containing protein [Rosistilla oblonga]|uniref:DUF192 domain-containing protein n=1 Tax=Rosistilla oblonga TaxID=2527990 RepID=UPI003A96B7D4
MHLIDSQTNEVLLDRVAIAATPWQRFCGLMLRRQFEPGFALWLDPCRSIHTMWMRVPIDVYFLDDMGTILEHRSNVAPWSIVLPAGRARSVLEIPNAAIRLAVGSRVRLSDPNQ